MESSGSAAICRTIVFRQTHSEAAFDKLLEINYLIDKGRALFLRVSRLEGMDLSWNQGSAWDVQGGTNHERRESCVGKNAPGQECSNMSDNGTTSCQPIVLAADLLGPPPVIAGEDADEFAELLERVRDRVKPSGIIEEIWVRDVLDLTWDIRRLRRLKASLLRANAHKGLLRVLTPLLDWFEAQELSESWARGKANSVKKVEKLLTGAGLTMDAVMAETFAELACELNCMENMIALAERRLAAALREIDRHRVVLAEALRRARKEVEDAEYEDVARLAPSEGLQ